MLRSMADAAKHIWRFVAQKLNITRFVCLGSAVVGLVCYAVSSYRIPSGNWNLLTKLLYSVFGVILCLAILFAKRLQEFVWWWWFKPLSPFLVFAVSTAYSGLCDEVLNQQNPDAYSIISCVAFVIMCFTLSKLTHLGFVADLQLFFCGFLIAQLMKIKFPLFFVGAGISFLAYHYGNHDPAETGGNDAQVETDDDVREQFPDHIGVCYGTMGDNLPPPKEVVELCLSNNIKRLRLYDSNKDVLEALRNSGIEITLGVPNSDIESLATDADKASQWVREHVLSFFPSVNIKYIVVGNEVYPILEDTYSLAQYVLRAIKNIHEEIKALKCHDKIKVSTAIGMNLLRISYPPSEGSFRHDVRSYIYPIISYMVEARAPILLNVYPYFSHCYDPGVPLPYALFSSPNGTVRDGKYSYQNLFDAMLDAMHAAIDSTEIGYVKVVVSESGWPSNGGLAASSDNAHTYLNNLIRRIGKGTPRRPKQSTEIYVFNMFDENKKNDEVHRHFGLFFPNKQKKYTFDFDLLRTSTLEVITN